MEILGCDLGVLLHVGPQVRTVLGPVAVAQLHAVAPADQLPTDVHVGACRLDAHTPLLMQAVMQVLSFNHFIQAWVQIHPSLS